jgi:SAM-dependent methyltransferase
VPLAQLGWDVLGVDLSMPMLLAAHARADAMRVDAARVDAARVDAARVDAARVDATCAQGACRVVRSTMDALPIPDEAVSLVIAHGIWNLAASDAEFRRAVREAARVSRPGAGLFVFTFSRHTIGPDAEPVAGESYVFTEFSGRPQCFLTEQQLLAELDDAGFDPDASVPLVEYNRPAQRILRTTGTPVIFEAAFRFRGRAA